MSANLEELEKQARLLPAEERASLAESLLASLHTSHVAEVEAAWTAEIEYIRKAIGRNACSVAGRDARIDGAQIIGQSE